MGYMKNKLGFYPLRKGSGPDSVGKSGLGNEAKKRRKSSL